MKQTTINSFRTWRGGFLLEQLMKPHDRDIFTTTIC